LPSVRGALPHLPGGIGFEVAHFGRHNHNAKSEALPKLGRCKDEAGAMGQFAALRRQKIEDFEELEEVVPGTRREIVQLERGKIKGEIAHATIGDLPIDTASFNLGIRSRADRTRTASGIGLLAASAGHVVRSSYDSRAGDVLVMQPDCEHENRYYGGASIVVVMASEADHRVIVRHGSRYARSIVFGRKLTTKAIPRR
jgi:hypothetical protein